MTKRTVNSINADNRVFKVNKHSQDDAPSTEFNLCRVAHQVTIPAYLQGAVLISSQSAGLMTKNTHVNVVEHRCFKPVQGFMDIFPSKRFFVYILTMTSKRVNLPKFLIVGYACML